MKLTGAQTGVSEVEEVAIYFCFAGAVVCLLILLIMYLRKNKDEDEPSPVPAPRAPQRGPARAQVNRRIPAVRNRRAPRRQADGSDSDGEGGGDRDGDHDDLANVRDNPILNDPKLGAKKRAKLEAKLEKKAHREAEERLREEQKVRDAKLEEERKKREDLEAKDEAEKKAEEKQRLEDLARREEEEYMKMKEAFSVEEEGCSVPDPEDEGNLLENFVAYIKETKLILFEELATKFNLKVPEAIDRLNTLVSEGRITGVMDDRGKFIYISKEDLEKFAKFIKQRGRVSIAELVDYSAEIINIEPKPAASGVAAS